MTAPAAKRGSLRRELFACLGHPGLSAGSTLLLVVLRLYSDDNGDNCYPSLETLTKQMRCSKRKVIAMILELEKAGFLLTIKRSAGGRGHSHRYRINVQRLNGSAEEPIKATGNGSTGEPIRDKKRFRSRQETVPNRPVNGSTGELERIEPLKTESVPAPAPAADGDSPRLLEGSAAIAADPRAQAAREEILALIASKRVQ